MNGFKEIDLSELKNEDLVTTKVLIEAFKRYLVEMLGYSKAEADTRATDMNNPYILSYVHQRNPVFFDIGGITYQIRYCYTDFRLCGIYSYTGVEPFEFYMLFDKDTMPDTSVASYRNARKKYVIKR